MNTNGIGRWVRRRARERSGPFELEWCGYRITATGPVHRRQRRALRRLARSIARYRMPEWLREHLDYVDYVEACR